MKTTRESTKIANTMHPTEEKTQKHQKGVTFLAHPVDERSCHY